MREIRTSGSVGGAVLTRLSVEDSEVRVGSSNVSFRSCTLEDPEFESQSFDVVMAMNLLHLFDDLPARLRRIRELVRPGGLFISKTPCVGDQGLAVRIAIPIMQAVGFAPYVNFVTEGSLGADITSAGFVVEETGLYPKKSRSFFVVARSAS